MRNSLRFLFTYLIFSAALEAADFFDPLHSISRTRHWRLLLHMEGQGNYWKSRMESKNFFFSKNGKKNPDDELKATIKAFEKGFKGNINKHPICRFPARKMFLEKKLNHRFKKIHCPEYTEWKKGINAMGMTLVFASSYPGNPASMFGHTFLRFKRGNKKNDLLDYGASYGANTDGSDNPIFYALKGLFGGYKASFSVSPYYQKVNEYAQIESRDLWEYEMNLSSEQINLVVAHLWELYYNGWFDYWFIDENCSYVLAALINIADPRWQLIDNHKWFVMPHDIVKRVSSQIPLRSIKYRPGVKKVLEQRLDYLTSDQKNNFQKISKGKRALKIDTPTLDAALDYFNYKKMKQKGRMSRQDDRIYKKLLVKRSKRKEKGNLVLVSTKNRPDDSHQSSLIALTLLHDKNDFSFQFTNEQIYKDWTDADKGYEPFSRFRAFGFSLKASKLRIEFENLNFISATSHTPLNTINPSPSWEVNSGLSRIWDDRCDSCLALNLEAKIGFSIINNHDFLFTLLGGGFAQAHDDLPDAHSAGWILTSRVAHAANDKLKFFVEGNIKFDQTNKTSDWYLDSAGGVTLTFERFGDFQLKTVVQKIKNGSERIVHQCRN